MKYTMMIITQPIDVYRVSKSLIVAALYRLLFIRHRIVQRIVPVSNGYTLIKQVQKPMLILILLLVRHPKSD
jgi:hypothetical protein